MSDKVLVCRRCRLKPELVKETARADMLRCPRCGANGVVGAMLEQAAQYEGSKMIGDFSKKMERSTRGLKNVRFERGKRSPGAPPIFVYH